MIEYDESRAELRLSVQAVPRASRTEIKGEYDGALRLRVAAPPVDGAANAEVIRFFSKLFNLPASSIELASGSASKRKVVLFSGISRDKALEISSAVQ